MKQTFTVSRIRDLLNLVYNEKITFSRFVEILNEDSTREQNAEGALPAEFTEPDFETKFRWETAAKAMQGRLVNAGRNGFNIHDEQKIVDEAIVITSLLISELKKQKP